MVQEAPKHVEEKVIINPLFYCISTFCLCIKDMKSKIIHSSNFTAQFLWWISVSRHKPAQEFIVYVSSIFRYPIMVDSLISLFTKRSVGYLATEFTKYHK